MPVVGSIPIVPRKIPKAPEMSPLTIESPTREMTRVMPSAIREKYSGGPKRMAKAARGGARSIRPMTLRVPAIKEPIADIPNAAPALPCWPIW